MTWGGHSGGNQDPASRYPPQPPASPHGSSQLKSRWCWLRSPLPAGMSADLLGHPAEHGDSHAWLALGRGGACPSGSGDKTEAILAAFDKKRARRRKRGAHGAPGGGAEQDDPQVTSPGCCPASVEPRLLLGVTDAGGRGRGHRQAGPSRSHRPRRGSSSRRATRDARCRSVCKMHFLSPGPCRSGHTHRTWVLGE